MSTLMSAYDLHDLIRQGHPLTVLDVRWRLDQPDGRADHLSGHIPGAVYVDLDHELSEHGAPAEQGRHPIPTLPRLQAAARRWGLHAADTVVVHDDLGNMAAARAWWLLRRAGLGEVRVLDGALAAWRAAGLPLETSEADPSPGSAILQDPRERPGEVPETPGAGAALSAWSLSTVRELSDQLRAGREARPGEPRATLIDVRAAERYSGAVEPKDPRAGHIPGAVNLPTTGNLDEDGRFLSPEHLRSRLRAAGAEPDRPVLSYCGSGVTAAHATLAAHLAGFETALYPGSFSQWSQHPELEVATGE